MADEIGSAVLDTLQIYFPWDDDFYTYVKERDFGTEGHERKALPLIYTDNCESTTGEKKTQRRFVLHPNYFEREMEELGWEEGDGSKDQIVIPSEKPELEFHLKGDELHLVVNPSPEGEEEYHIEYSSRASFGKMYSNWANFYITMEDFYSLSKSLEEKLDLGEVDLPEMESETKQNQREGSDFVEVPVDYYRFSLGEFDYAREYLRHNGFSDEIPSLVYDSDDENHQKSMNPVLKYGTLKTKTDDDFWEREQQVMFKIAQTKTTKSQRGKDAKVKGELEFPAEQDNRVILDAEEMLKASRRIRQFIQDETEQSDLSSY